MQAIVPIICSILTAFNTIYAFAYRRFLANSVTDWKDALKALLRYDLTTGTATLLRGVSRLARHVSYTLRICYECINDPMTISCINVTFYYSGFVAQRDKTPYRIRRNYDNTTHQRP